MEPIVFSHKVKINDFSVKCLFKLSERENKSLYVNSKSLSSIIAILLMYLFNSELNNL